jgi:hypothetical protein
METSLPKRVLFIYPIEGPTTLTLMQMASDLQSKVFEVTGISNIVFDCTRDPYEGLVRLSSLLKISCQIYMPCADMCAANV